MMLYKSSDMRRLQVASICPTSTVSRADGARLRAAIEAAWIPSEALVLDFSGLRIASASFLDEALGLLARTHSLEELAKRVRVENIDAADRVLLNKIVQLRAEERRDSAPASV
jgi:hypothetical protein